jgi:hypothetical protein
MVKRQGLDHSDTGDRKHPQKKIQQQQQQQRQQQQ